MVTMEGGVEACGYAKWVWNPSSKNTSALRAKERPSRIWNALYVGAVEPTTCWPFKLFDVQRLYRFDLRGADGRQPHRNERDHDQDKWRCQEGNRIPWAYVEEEA